MAIRITDTEMTLMIGKEIVATARFSKHAAAANAWIVSTQEASLFTRNQAITALSLAECLAAGHGEDDPHVIGWRRE